MSTLLHRSDADRSEQTETAEVELSPQRRVAVWLLLLQATGVGLVAVALAAVLYRVWRAAWNRPITTNGGDMYQIESLVKTIVETGWFQYNPRLNVPYGSYYYDFPQNGEFLQMVELRILAVFSNRPGAIVNDFYFIGFFLLAAFTYLCFRYLRRSGLVSAMLALAFTFLPFHFIHNEQHLFRSTYVSVPVACLLMLWCGGWRSFFLRDGAHDPDKRWRDQILWRRVLLALAAGVFVGAWETMITAFTVLLLVVLTGVDFVRERDWRRLVVGAGATLSVLGTFVIVSLPSIWFSHVHGPNATAGHRSIDEAERYGLKIDKLLLPLDGSRVPELQKLPGILLAGYGRTGGGGIGLNFLGAIGYLGLLVALGVGFRYAGRAVGRTASWVSDGMMQRTAAVAVITATLSGTVGGFSALTGLAGLQDVREWGRIALIIAFFALLQIGLWADSLRGWLRRRHVGLRWLSPVLVVIVTVLALADGPPVRRLDYQAVDAEWRANNAYISRIEQVMPKNSLVMQVPAWGFPEVPPPPGLKQDENFIPYLADTGTLRWSCCGIHGRPWTDWQGKFRNASTTAEVLPGMLGFGFTGLLLDTNGLADQKAGVAQLRRTIGYAPIVSANGRYQFYDLRAYRKTLPQSDAQLRQLAITTVGAKPPS